MKSKPNEAFPDFSENENNSFVPLMAIEIFKFENRTSDGEFFCRLGLSAKEGLTDLCDMEVYPTNWW